MADYHVACSRRLHKLGAARGRDKVEPGIGLHVPMAFAVAIFAYLTLVVIRPIPMGSWGYAFPAGDIQPSRLGVKHRLHPHGNFHYNPVHMLAVSLLFTTAFALSPASVV